MEHLFRLFAAGLGLSIGGFLLFFLVLCIALPLLIGILVYRDASGQEMSSPLLWALVAALAPSFTGLIVYLVVRCTRGRGRGT